MSELISSQSCFNACNLACGGKLCLLPGWLNVDHKAFSPEVFKVNLLKKFPFEDNYFDVVYVSQFIEHLDHHQGLLFLQECCRILRPGGVLRVVTPDLENMTRTYLQLLEELSTTNIPSDLLFAKYNWIKLEIFDQIVRHKSGGDMNTFLSANSDLIAPFLQLRLGQAGIDIISCLNSPRYLKHSSYIRLLINFIKYMRKAFYLLLPQSLRIGQFRTSGEPHLYLYDRISLDYALNKVGFTSVHLQSWDNSLVDKWKYFNLDNTSEGIPYAPTSLFMEAIK